MCKDFRRRPMLERLETRIAMVAEGALYNLPNISVDPLGYRGTVSANVNWGDGTSDRVVLGQQSVPSGIRIVFDYSLDTRRFFAQQSRRRALEEAADSITQYLRDTLDPITPGGQNRWIPKIFHPSSGAANSLFGTEISVANRIQSVPANHIIVFVGSRSLPSRVRGFATTGFFSDAFGTPDFLDSVVSRGEPGARPASKTDHAPWGGTITFDDSSGTDWYFDSDPDGIGPEQLDFRTYAAHELIHILGFGLEFPASSGLRTSWQNLSPGSTFNGPRARSEFGGNVPLDVRNGTKGHWADSVEENGLPTVMPRSLASGERRLLTRLDLAALDDLGWEVTYPARMNLTAQHIYADDPSGSNNNYPITITVNGATLGKDVIERSVNVTNVSPEITSLPAPKTIRVGQLARITGSELSVSDPGYGNQDGGESFTFTIDWMTGSEPQTSEPTTVRRGGEGFDTTFNVLASQQYTEPGNYNVDVTVEDDDGGFDRGSFRINVLDLGILDVQSSGMQLAEGESDELMVTVSRDGLTSASVIDLRIDGGGQFDVPASIRFAAGETQVQFPVVVIDDRTAERNDEFPITITGPGYHPVVLPIGVEDNELPLFQNSQDRFDVNGQGGTTELDALVIINALGVRGTAFELFPNQQQADGVFLDVSGDYQVSPVDALQVVNELARARNGNSEGEDARDVRSLGQSELDEKETRDVDEVFRIGELF